MLHTCGGDGAAKAGGERLKVKRGKSLIVDIHCHVLTPEAEARSRDLFKPEYEPTLRFASEHSREVNRAQAQAIRPQLTSVERRLADMDRMGIDMRAISPSPTQYYYWAEPGLGRKLARLINNRLAEIVAGTPERFVALGTVPLQHPELAVAELTRMVRELGFRGVEISSNVAGRELSEPDFAPFFAKAEELGCLIFLHPLGFTEGRRLSEHYFNNVIGNPLESTIAVSHLIFGGVLDRHPGLKLCIAHGGGYLPLYAGRMDHAHGARADCRAHIAAAPSSYLKRLYFDSVVFSPRQLAHLIETYGPEHILLGTDYPFDMGEDDPLGLVAAVPKLKRAERKAICGGNAARLLGIEGTRKVRKR